MAGHYYPAKEDELMALYLVQHGKALQKDVDPERGLSDEGIAEVERIAGVAQGYRVTVRTIRHSGKKRARQTAELIAAALSAPVAVEQGDGLKPNDDVITIAKSLDESEDLMLVGHLPFLERLASYLVMGITDRRIFALQNGGILCLDRDPGSQFWFIRWALMPHVGAS